MSRFNTSRSLRRCLVVAAGLASLPIAAADPQPPAETASQGLALDAPLDPSVIYRYDLLANTLFPIDRAKLKPGHVYYRPDGTGRHVWSRVDASGRLRYDIGPGSSIPARYFDPVADQETRRAALASRAPELARRLAVEGAKPSVALGNDGQWRLEQSVNEGRVFDRATGERFEWHMGTPVPVVNSAGNSWIWTGSGYRPPTLGYGGPEPTPDWSCGCW